MGGAGALFVAFFAGAFALLLLVASLGILHTGLVSWSYLLSDYVLALAGLFGIATVPAIHERIAHRSEGWMRWTSTLALIGFALMAITGFWQAEYETSLIDVMAHFPYEKLPGSTVQVTPMSVFMSLLGRVPLGWFEAAGIGLWIFSVSWLARGTALLPRGLIRIGLTGGILSIAAMLGAAPQMALLLLPAVMTGGLLLSTVWFYWMGRLLLREERSAKEKAQEKVGMNWKETLGAEP